MRSHLLQWGLRQGCTGSGPKLYKPVGMPSASYTSSANKNTSEIPGPESRWTTVYKLPHIGIVSALNRTKWYQLGATLLATPLAYGLEMAGELSSGIALVCGVVGVSATVSTTLFSYLSRGTVGFMYMNAEETSVRFSYVDVNGKRIEQVVDLEAVRALEENKLYIPVEIKDGHQQRLKVFHRYGVVVDVMKFNDILS